MPMFSITPGLLSLGAAALVLSALIYALVWADGVPSRDVRTLFRRRRPRAVPTPEPAMIQNPWIALVAPDLAPSERDAFVEFATRIRPDFHRLGREHVEALYETWRLWGNHPR